MSSQSKNYYVVNHPDGWAVKGANADRAIKVFDTQKEAQNLAVGLAQKSSGEIAIQGKNGQFRQKNSYGNDPFPPKG